MLSATVTAILPGSTVSRVPTAILLVTVTVTVTQPSPGRDPAAGDTFTLAAMPAGTLIV